MIWKNVLGGHIIRPSLRCGDDRCQDYKNYHVGFLNVGFNPSNHRFSLLRVCRQIYSEAAMLPWQSSTFRFAASFDLKLWLGQTTTTTRRLIRQVEHGEGRFWGMQVDRWKYNLGKLPNIKRFDVIVCSKYARYQTLDDLQNIDALKTEMKAKRGIEIGLELLPMNKHWMDIFKNGD